MRESSNIINRVLCGACFLSCISQLPYFVTSGLTQRICFPLWLLSFLILAVNSKGIIDKSIVYLIIPTAIFFLLLFFSVVIKNDVSYFSSSLVYSFEISMFIFCIGNLAGRYNNLDMMKKIFLSYMLGTIIVSINVFFQYFGFKYNLNTRIYGYASKNSLAQIVLTTIILLMVYLKPDQVWKGILKWGIIAFEILLMVYLKSRATLIGFLVVIIFVSCSKEISKKLRAFIVLCGVTLIVLLLTNQDVEKALFHNILFAGRDASDLDGLSSGRISILSQFPVLMKGNWLFGIGATYYECFPLSAILQFGLPAGLTLIIVAIIPLIVSIRNSRKSEFWYILMLISVVYTINGLFEGLTPFGAGIKCFFLWFLFGLLNCEPTFEGGKML